MYELLSRYPIGVKTHDNAKHLPIEIAADKAYEQPSAAMDLVVSMLSEPDKAPALSGNSERFREWQAQLREVAAPKVQAAAPKGKTGVKPLTLCRSVLLHCILCAQGVSSTSVLLLHFQYVQHM